MVTLAFKHIEFGLITPEMAFNGAEDDTGPKTFHEAWDHNNPDKRAIWRSTIKDEFAKMNKKRLAAQKETRYSSRTHISVIMLGIRYQEGLDVPCEVGCTRIHSNSRCRLHRKLCPRYAICNAKTPTYVVGKERFGLNGV